MKKETVNMDIIEVLVKVGGHLKEVMDVVGRKESGTIAILSSWRRH
jgi:hypothetical protein